MIVKPGLIKSQKNRPGSDGGSVSLKKLNYFLDIYLGALATLQTQKALEHFHVSGRYLILVWLKLFFDNLRNGRK